jgi:excisionase family DNA binding protein
MTLRVNTWLLLVSCYESVDAKNRLVGSEAPPDWVGIEEAARCLGVSKQTVVTWVKQVKLQAVRATVGRRTGWKIQVKSVDSAKQRSLF